MLWSLCILALQISTIFRRFHWKIIFVLRYIWVKKEHYFCKKYLRNHNIGPKSHGFKISVTVSNPYLHRPCYLRTFFRNQSAVNKKHYPLAAWRIAWRRDDWPTNFWFCKKSKKRFSILSNWRSARSWKKCEVKKRCHVAMSTSKMSKNWECRLHGTVLLYYWPRMTAQYNC
jgi:hypothetical protein